MAKKMLEHRNLLFEEKMLDTHFTKEWILEQYPHATLFPLIVWDGFYIGGSKELRHKLHESDLNTPLQLLNE